MHNSCVHSSLLTRADILAPYLRDGACKRSVQRRLLQLTHKGIKCPAELGQHVLCKPRQCHACWAQYNWLATNVSSRTDLYPVGRLVGRPALAPVGVRLLVLS